VHGIPAATVLDADGNVAYLGNSLSDAVGVPGSFVTRSR